MAQVPMISSPLKQTNEIDWIAPLKSYIRGTYGDDPERYAEECSSLNRLRQDMRGAGKDSAAGRDLLYRYYGQLELLDLRFPVDENHIKISFTWFDAFTNKPTSQHSLAYEKASIIFNIAAVLSCYAAVQNRHEESGLKTAYHCFQASAGMFTYINENFLHAPSVDLNHDTIKTLIGITLAQAQEVFMEKQINDGKKPAMIAKLASQAAHIYSQALEGVQENVTKSVFEKVWLLLTQIKAGYTACLAEYFQALSDNETKAHGAAIARLKLAQRQAKETMRLAKGFPNSPPPNSNLSSDTGSSLVETLTKYATLIEEKIAEFLKDNDFIYHQPIPSEAALTTVSKLPAAKAISVSELYQGQDIHKIIGPDIFQKIVPMSVTESASLYDEEKAKMVRAESERAEIANVEMTASLDYLKLPGSLNVLKGGAEQDLEVDEEFRNWCHELAGHVPFTHTFADLVTERQTLTVSLDHMLKQLDTEESLCEKMRAKYGADWDQVPSSRLTSTLKSDIRAHRAAIDEAGGIDVQLQNNLRQHESDYDEMRSAGELDEADVLYQRALIKAGATRGKDRNGGQATEFGGHEGNLIDDDFEDGSTSVAEQIAGIEELIHKLNLVKRERAQVLKDLKEKVHNDDISHVLILNKKSITNQEHQLFKAELEKFKPYQTRLLQASHKQASIVKELTRQWNDSLRDKRVRNEYSKHEGSLRQKSSVLARYRKIYQAFKDLDTGVARAQGFYSHTKSTVESISENVNAFVANRKSEGGDLLRRIENSRSSGTDRQADQERERLQGLMERMNMNDVKSTPRSPPNRPMPQQHTSSYQQNYSPMGSSPAAFANSIYAQPTQSPYPQQAYPPQVPTLVASPNYRATNSGGATQPYNPSHYGMTSPMAPSPYFSPPVAQNADFTSSALPTGYVPPPPPPGGPPPTRSYPAINGQGNYVGSYQPNQWQQPQTNKPSGDPWAGLSGW